MLDYKIRLKKTIIWGIATAFSIYLFYFLIPIDIYESMTTFLALVGSISITICTCAFIFCFISLFDKVDENGKVKDSSYLGYLIFIVIMISLFGNGALIIWTEVKNESRELDKNGVIVMAKIVDGSSYSSRKFDFSNLSVAFTDAKGFDHTINVDISKYEFEKFYLHQEVPIVYSTKYITINRVIYKEEDFFKYPKQ